MSGVMVISSIVSKQFHPDSFLATRGFCRDNGVLCEKTIHSAYMGVDKGLSGDVIRLTSMPRRKQPPGDAKSAALHAAGALHPHPEQVQDEAFLTHEFFDPRDRVQVKYEMLRRHRVDGQAVSEVARSFHVSRQAFYAAQGAFEADGLCGLLRQRPGPKRAHKCTEEILEFAEQLAPEELRAADIAEAVHERFGITVHPRSLKRALVRHKKKRLPRSSTST